MEYVILPERQEHSADIQDSCFQAANNFIVLLLACFRVFVNITLPPQPNRDTRRPRKRFHRDRVLWYTMICYVSSLLHR
jgi:hypothetical protein